jgi:hypothetical protein
LARQHWKPQQKILYPEIESILAQNDEDEPAEVNFKKSRRSHDVVRSFRTIGGVIVVMAVTSYYATPAALKFTMGEVGYKKLEASANQTVKKILKPQSQPRKVSSRIDTKRL